MCLLHSIQYSLSVLLFFFLFCVYYFFPRNFNGDIFLLVLGVSNAFRLGASLCVVSGNGSGAASVVGSRVKVLFSFIIGNALLLKSLRTFSIAVKNDPMLFRKDLF